jgi:hypothetical protein
LSSKITIVASFADGGVCYLTAKTEPRGVAKVCATQHKGSPVRSPSEPPKLGLSSRHWTGGLRPHTGLAQTAQTAVTPKASQEQCLGVDSAFIPYRCPVPTPASTLCHPRDVTVRLKASLTSIYLPRALLLIPRRKIFVMAGNAWWKTDRVASL